MSRSKSVFIDKTVLDFNYVPQKLLHRDDEANFLSSLFRFIVDAPYEMSQRALIIGGVGSGKTALAQRFGLDLLKEAERRRVRAEYVHVNCRESRGSLFMALQRAVKRLRPQFPDRGYSSNELLDTLMRILDEEDTQLVLCLDEVDTLIEREGGDAIYNLCRVQEERLDGPRRLSLIFISKSSEAFRDLDRSTLSTLQRNVIRMPDYTMTQLSGIVASRAEMAFRPGAMPPEIIDFIGELAASESGDARYAIDLLHGSGMYADSSRSQEVLPEHVRKAAAGLFPAIKPEELRGLSRHEQLALLGIARFFLHSREAKATTGEAETSYRVVCEEYGEAPRGHTQFWKYLNALSGLGAISTELSASEKGRTQLIGLPKMPAEELERRMVEIVGRG
jgi:cell division control protein 6